MITITKEFTFEMAHALWNYDGKCKNIHGHTYKLIVTVQGEIITDKNSPKLGMVMDFGELKRIVKENIIDTHDHYLVLNGKSPHKDLNFSNYNIELVQYKDYQPTCENLLMEFVDILKRNLPENIRLVKLRLYETPTSYAEWTETN